MMNDQEAFAIAVEEAKISYAEGGVPVRLTTTYLPLFIFILLFFGEPGTEKTK
jgi:hypothetical protein